MSTADLPFLIAFSTIPSIGAATISRLRSFFPTFEEAWNAPVREYQRAGIPEKSAMLLADATKHLVPSEELEKVRQAGIHPIVFDDPTYPHLLREIPDSPQLLYCRGNMPGIRPTIAIVGTRKATTYGHEVARRMSHELATRGISIVSGLALGIDAAAHESAVDALGHTTAVL
ncbi:MAG: DNA-processing protein DprA, partial [Parcubacteria group bacterium]